MTMTRTILAGMMLATAFAGPVAADDATIPDGVVELFTSQGCSSCPPADANLGDLANRGSVVALAYHVDYWDYLGWKDTLANAANTARQNGYAKTLGERSVYTPQAVLDGRAHVNGADAEAIAAGLGQSRLNVPVRLNRVGDRIIAETGAGPVPGNETVIVFAWFKSDATVKVERGENRGSTIHYVNSVVSLGTTGMYHGEAGQYEMPVSEAARAGADGVAVLVQEIGIGGAPGAILGAALMRL